MKSSGILLITLIIGYNLASCTGGGETTVSEMPAQYTAEQFMETDQIFGSSFAPDESSILFTSKRTGIYNSFSVPVEGGDVTQLTNSTQDYSIALSFFPEDERFLFTSDHGGNEINHIYLQDMNGSVRDLTPDSTAKAQFYGWADDNKSFFLTTNKRDPRFFDLYEMDISSSQPGEENPVMTMNMVYENDGFALGPISGDKKWLTLIKPNTTNDNNLLVRNLENGKTIDISEHEGDASYSPEYFSKDNSKLYFTSNQGSEFMDLREYDLATGETKKVESADWDVVFAGRSKSGKYRYIGINADARTEIRLYDTETGERVNLPIMPNADISNINISDSDKLMAFYVNSSVSPNSLYVYNFETKEYRLLVNALNPEINPDDLVDGEVIRFASFDGLEIPALLYKPKGIKEGEMRPAILDIHGGPGGQRRLTYSSTVQYLVNAGYVVLSVNNRGSSGYGKSFFAMDDRKHGDVDLKDCIWSKKFLESTGYVDPEKIGITGGSYGGYMVMAALTFTPDEFAVGVNYFGVTNWLRTLKSIPPWWTAAKDALYDEMGDPYQDSVLLYDQSPLFHADKITKPFIVFQGANDPRVLKVESDEIVSAAEKNGVPVEYVVFDDEGHGFVKKENNIESMKRERQFLDKYLWKKESDSM